MILGLLIISLLYELDNCVSPIFNYTKENTSSVFKLLIRKEKILGIFEILNE